MFKRAILIVIGFSCAMAAVGCQSMGMDDKSSKMTTDSGVVAVSNHGSVVFLKGNNGDVQMLSTTGDANCAQCKMDAAEYFKTGKIAEKCPACGAQRFALMRGK